MYFFIHNIYVLYYIIKQIFILNSVETYESTRPHDDLALLEKLEILAAEYENDEKTEIVPKVQPERFEFLPMTLPEPKTIFQDLRVSNPDAPKGIFYIDLNKLIFFQILKMKFS